MRSHDAVRSSHSRFTAQTSREMQNLTTTAKKGPPRDDFLGNDAKKNWMMSESTMVEGKESFLTIVLLGRSCLLVDGC